MSETLAGRVALRRAVPDDAQAVFGWRNDPFIVQLGSSRAKVTWVEHQAWFEGKLADRNCLMLIVQKDAQPIGQVRFDKQADGGSMISVYLLEAHVGTGLGVDAIRQGCRQAAQALGTPRILACVREENLPGQKAFAKAGFQRAAGAACPEGHVAMLLDSTRARDDARNIDIYTSLAARYGHDVRALDWASRESQEQRFRVLAGVGDLNGRAVLDVGCGLGDFAAWCARQSIAPDYTGIDITPRMVELAQECLPAQTFRTADLFSLPLPPEGRAWDYVVASGIFAKRQENPEGYLRDAVARMFALSKAATAFNVLSTWATATEGSEYHADPVRTLDYCRTLTPWAVLRHDYHPRDFTVYLYKTRQP